MRFLTNLADRLLTFVEKLFPLVPMKTREEVEAVGEKWIPEWDYYCLDLATDKRLWWRVLAIACLDRNKVSWLRRRREYLQDLRDLEAAGYPQGLADPGRDWEAEYDAVLHRQAREELD